MKDLKLVIRETGDTSPGMEGAVHIDFNDSAYEPCLPYVEREVAEEMVRRWNTYNEHRAALEQIAQDDPCCLPGKYCTWNAADEWMARRDIARKALKATNP